MVNNSILLSVIVISLIKIHECLDALQKEFVDIHLMCQVPKLYPHEGTHTY